MLRRVWVQWWLLLFFCALGAYGAQDFSFVFIGDPHLNFYSAPYTVWTTQTQWIASHQAEYNIQGVFATGDYIVGNVAAAWNTGGHGWIDIDRMNVPYGTATGNHDYDSDAPAGRRTTNFDTQVGYSRVSAKSWFGGYWTGDPNGDKANYYLKFTIGTRKFLVFCLELYPRKTLLTWAGGIISANPDHEVVIMEHAYLNGDRGTLPTNGLIGWSGNFSPSSYDLNSTTDSAGTELNTWALAYPNIRAIICGHTGYYNRRTDTGNAGNTFHGLQVDYQSAHPSSQTVLLVQFNATNITVSNVNTTTGLIDDSIYPPETLVWSPITGGSPVPQTGSAASGAPTLAPSAIASVFGLRLASSPQSSSTQPPPVSLGGVTVMVKDSAAVTRTAPLYFVSPTQVNFVIPPDTAPGTASVMVQSAGAGPAVTTTTEIRAVAPALFTAAANGTGVAAATAIQVIGARQNPVSVFSCSKSGCGTVPIDLGVDAPVYLTLYGTGIRGRTLLANVSCTVGGVSVPVLYAGPQPEFAGLDQVNVALTLNLRGIGETDLVVVADGVPSNPVRINIR